MCWSFSSLSTLNKHMSLIQFLKLSANMKIADLGPRQASKLEHFGKITFSQKTPSSMLKDFRMRLCFRIFSENSHGYYDFYISEKFISYEV